MILRFREDNRNDRHCWISVFSGHYLGPDNTTLGKSGDLCLDTDVWDALKAALPQTFGSRDRGVFMLELSADRASRLPTGSPTEEELDAAYDRLKPYMGPNAYPEPMIDSRRWRIAFGNETEQDRREIAAEDAVIRRLREERTPS